MKYVLTFILAVSVTLLATYFISGQQRTEPELVTSSDELNVPSADLLDAQAAETKLAKDLAIAKARIQELEAAAALAAAQLEEAQTADEDMEEVAEAGDEEIDEDEERAKSMDEIRQAIKGNPGASAQIQALTELIYADFLNALELDPDTKAELRLLLGESYMESLALDQYAIRNGEATWSEVTAWKDEERAYLDSQLKNVLSAEQSKSWDKYSEDIEMRQLDTSLRN